jgi:hypothetical protein
MYDTLMQMGRWFGYRDDYLDTCRIYTTDELMDWYRHIATASLELRNELDYMALLNSEPQEFGLKVLSHPGRLAVTSAGKMRNAERLSLSYAGRISETIVFDPSYSKSNLDELGNLITNMGQHLVQQNEETRFHWKNVEWHQVVDFLKNYRMHEGAKSFADPPKWAEFIELQIPQGELVTWDVVLISPSSPVKTTRIAGLDVGFSVRQAEVSASKISIGRLVNPTDEWLDFSAEEKSAVQTEWVKRRRKQNLPTEISRMRAGAIIREFRLEQRGLLLIYPICSGEKGVSYGLTDEEGVVGLAVSFPSSDTALQVDYVSNSVYQDAEN